MGPNKGVDIADQYIDQLVSFFLIKQPAVILLAYLFYSIFLSRKSWTSHVAVIFEINYV